MFGPQLSKHLFELNVSEKFRLLEEKPYSDTRIMFMSHLPSGDGGAGGGGGGGGGGMGGGATAAAASVTLVTSSFGSSAWSASCFTCF